MNIVRKCELIFKKKQLFIMILDIDSIFDNIISYKNKNNYSLDKMAELFGMKGKGSFSRVLDSRNVGIKYFIQFLNNPEVNANEILYGFANMNLNTYNPYFSETTSPNPAEVCQNPQCLGEIRMLKRNNDILLNYIEDLREKIKRLNTGKGEAEHEKLSTGGVEKNRNAG